MQVQGTMANAQQDMNQRFSQISQSLQQAAEFINQGYAQHSQVYDRIGQMWSNAILGYQDMVSPGGERFNVPSGYDQYWANHLGDVFAGDWGTQPGIDWLPLDPTGI